MRDTPSSPAIRFAVALSIFLAYFAACVTQIDADLGWHLKVGEWELLHHAVQRFDVYTFSMPGQRWVDHEWLVNAWLAFMRSAGLWPLVIALFALVSWAPFGLWLREARTLLDTAQILLLSLAVAPFVGVRAQMISFALFAVVARWLARWFASFSWTSALALPVFFSIWANLHAGFFSGLMLFGVELAVGFWPALTRGNAEPWPRLFARTGVFLACLLAPLLNPYGLDLYRELVQASSSPLTTGYIWEWRPGLFAADASELIVFAWAILVIAAGWRALRLAELLPCAVFGVLFLRSIRMAPLWYVTLLPALRAALTRENRQAARAALALGFLREARYLASLALALALIALGWATATRGTFRMPEAATRYLRETRGPPIVLFNSYMWGGYLIDHAPETRIFIDGRMPHWVDAEGRSAMRDYVAARYGKPDDSAWKAVFERYGINAALLSKQRTIAPSWCARLADFMEARFDHVAPVTRIAELLRGPETIDLLRELREAGFSVVSDDGTAVLLRCLPPACTPGKYR